MTTHQQRPVTSHQPPTQSTTHTTHTFPVLGLDVQLLHSLPCVHIARRTNEHDLGIIRELVNVGGLGWDGMGREGGLGL